MKFNLWFFVTNSWWLLIWKGFLLDVSFKDFWVGPFFLETSRISKMFYLQIVCFFSHDLMNNLMMYHEGLICSRPWSGGLNCIWTILVVFIISLFFCSCFRLLNCRMWVMSNMVSLFLVQAFVSFIVACMFFLYLCFGSALFGVHI